MAEAEEGAAPPMEAVQGGWPMISLKSTLALGAGQAIRAAEQAAAAVEPSCLTVALPVISPEPSALSGKMPIPPRSRVVEEAAEAASTFMATPSSLEGSSMAPAVTAVTEGIMAVVAAVADVLHSNTPALIQPASVTL